MEAGKIEVGKGVWEQGSFFNAKYAFYISQCQFKNGIMVFYFKICQNVLALKYFLKMPNSNFQFWNIFF